MSARCSCSALAIHGASFPASECSNQASPFVTGASIFKINPGSIIMLKNAQIQIIEHEFHVYEIRCLKCGSSIFIQFSSMNIFAQLLEKGVPRRMHKRHGSATNIRNAAQRNAVQVVRKLIKIVDEISGDSYMMPSNHVMQSIKRAAIPKILTQTAYDENIDIDFDLMFSNNQAAVVGSCRNMLPSDHSLQWS